MESIYRRIAPMMYRRESRNAPTEKEAYEHDEARPRRSPANTARIYATYWKDSYPLAKRGKWVVAAWAF